MIIQYILGGIIILISLIIIGVGIFIICKGMAEGFFLSLMGIMLISPGVLIITDKPVPTKQDVIDGKAIYKETQIITGNDTIKTYEIVWKQKN